MTVEDRAAQNGDIAVIDFEGFVDDVAFEGGKAENFSLTLGSGQFIPGFEEQIVDHKTVSYTHLDGYKRQNQWFSIAKGFELLDTPGVLWPKFEDKEVGEHLAFTGAVKDLSLIHI